MPFRWFKNIFSRGKFRSKALRGLWESMSDISHPRHPFLDKEYSPNTQMPATDYTPWVAGRMAENDWPAIHELLSYLNYEHIPKLLIAATRRYAPPEWFHASPVLRNEIQTVLLLCGRIQESGSKENRRHLTAELLKHSLASYPFQTHPIDKPGLRKPIVYQPSPFASSLARFPVTFRACLADSITGPMFTLRPQGDYLLRQYGLSSKHNEAYFRELDIFGPVANLDAIASRLKKAQLVEIADQCGVETNRSWTKDVLKEAVLGAQSTHHLLAAHAPKNLLEVRPEYQETVNDWLGSLKKCEPIVKKL